MGIVSKEETLSREEEFLLKALDGELEGDALARFEASLSDHPALRTELEAGKHLRKGLREAYRQELESVDFSSFWDGVAQGIDTLPPREAVKVSAERRQSEPSFLERVRAWMSALTWRPIAAGAMAAAVLATVGSFQLLTQHGQPDVAKVVPSPGLPGNVIPEEKPSVTSGVEINSITAGPGSTVMVIRSPADATIIWVSTPAGGTAI